MKIIHHKLIAISLCFLAIIFFSLYWFINSYNKINLTTDIGNIMANNFISNPDTKKISDKIYELKTTTDYTISYYSPDNWFSIILTSGDTNKTRLKAEKDLLQILGINQKNACKLNLDLSVSFAVSPLLSGKNYGLSFCPNGQSFNSENKANGSSEPKNKTAPDPVFIAIAAVIIMGGIVTLFKFKPKK